VAIAFLFPGTDICSLERISMVTSEEARRVIAAAEQKAVENQTAHEHCGSEEQDDTVAEAGAKHSSCFDWSEHLWQTIVE
jgi:hypothetical protein